MNEQEQRGEVPPGISGKHGITGKEVYHVVSDTVAGPNVRLYDNLFQAAAILICLVLGTGIGYLVTSDGPTGAILGGIGGLLVGLFGSGIFLMIYRAIRHARGKHD
jgi:hypothetical protein